LSAPAQEGKLPLHLALCNKAGLDVVTTMLEVHMDAAAVADTVRAGVA